MVDLTEISGFSVFVNEEQKKIDYGQNVSCEYEQLVLLSHISPILLNRYLRYPESVYWHLKNLTVNGTCQSKSGTSFDLFYMPSGLLGIECIKSHIFFTKRDETKFACFVEVYSGELSITLQRNSLHQSSDYFDSPTEVEELHIVKLKKGERFAVPSGYFYTFSNTGITPLVFAKVSGSENKAIDYSILKKEKGLALYLILKNAKVETVSNPKYKITQKVKPTSLERFIKNNVLYRPLPLLNTRKPLYYLYADIFPNGLVKILS